MMSKLETGPAVYRAFTTAYLLSGSAECAEAAAMESIRLMNAEDTSAEELFGGTMNAAIALEETSGYCAREPWPNPPMLTQPR